MRFVIIGAVVVAGSVVVGQLAFGEGLCLCAAVDEALTPHAILPLPLVCADLDAAVGSLDECWTMEHTLLGGELGEVSALQRVGLDDALLPKFLSLLERPQLQNLILLID